MRYLFEDFCLDTSRRELGQSGVPVRLEPQVFDLLEYLILNRDRLVSRDDLIASVWEGRIVSESALATRINAARSAINDTGALQRLIKTIPRKGIRFVGEVREQAAVSRLRPADTGPDAAAPPLPERPSIAVLPFANLSDNPGQDYFADGIVEGIITGLCRMHWLFVIAHNSSFTFKGRAIDVKQVGRELGVRYVLNGSVQRSSSRVRVGVQLIDAATGAHIAANRFDRTLEDIFELQDEVSGAVVGALMPPLEKAEIARARRKPTDSLDAYDHYLQGLAARIQGTPDSITEAIRLFGRATEIDPEFAAAYGAAALCHEWRESHGWATNREHEVAEATRLALRALELGKDDAQALRAAGHVLGHLRDVEAGAELIDQALALNPNLAEAWLSGGWVRVWQGKADAAIDRFDYFMRLSPIDPRMFTAHAGTAAGHLIAGHHEEARLWAIRALRSHPTFAPALRVATAASAFCGRMEEAEAILVRLRRVDPGLALANIHDRAPWSARGLRVLVEGLRLSGLA